MRYEDIIKEEFKEQQIPEGSATAARVARKADEELAQKDKEIRELKVLVRTLKEAPGSVRNAISEGELDYLFHKHENKQAALAAVDKVSEEVRALLKGNVS